MNTIENRIWKILGIILAILSITIPAVVSYNLEMSNDSLIKQVQLDISEPILPLSDLNLLANKNDIEIKVGSTGYKNVVIQNFTLKNIGISPIVPSDFIKPISIRVNSPWKIISSRQRYDDKDKLIHWTNKTDQWVSSEPFLMNPGDYFRQTVYLTSTESISNLSTKKIKESYAIDISARIVGLKNFTKGNRPSHFYPLESKFSMVYLSIQDVIFLLIIASVILYWYLMAINKCNLATFPSRTAFFYIIIFSALSYMVAEVITYIIFGGNPLLEFYMGGQQLLNWRYQWPNWLILALHFSLVIYLSWRARNA